MGAWCCVDLIGVVMSRVHLVRRALLVSVATLPFAIKVHAHTYKADGLRVDHPYATPTPSGEKNSAVYFRSIDNVGKTADALIGARADIAERVEIRRLESRSAATEDLSVKEVSLLAGQGPSFKHNAPNGYYLLLVNLNGPLKNGDRFPIWLTFRHAGEKKVMVWVQTPRGSQAPQHDHKH
jgi:periplasmic copper chaperone A